MNTGRRAIIYTRVSRDDSGEGKSNDRQEEACRAWADLYGWEVIRVEEDISISAYSGKTRPGWERVLAAVEAGEVDLILAWHLDRMTRSMTELETLILLSQDHGVGVASVHGDMNLTTDVGRMVARILAAVARAEVERKGARQRLANQQRAAEGKPWPSGFRAYGYTLSGEVIESEAAAIREAADQALAGKSMKAICKDWNARGLRSVHARDGEAQGWTNRGIKSLLVNPRYAGIARYKGEEMGMGGWEPIFDRETHDLLVALLTDPGRRTNHRSGRDPENLLSGIARCDGCGETVAARKANGHKVYGCVKGCVATKRDEADALVQEAYSATLALILPGSLVPIERATGSGQRGAEVETLRERLSELARLFAEGAISSEQLESGSKPLRERIAKIEASLESPEPAIDAAMLRAKSVAAFKAMNLEEQRAQFSKFVEVTLFPKGRGRRNVSIREQVEMWITLPERDVPEESKPLPHRTTSRGSAATTPARRFVAHQRVKSTASSSAKKSTKKSERT